MSQQNTFTSKPWLAAYDSGVAESLEYEDATVVDYLFRAAAESPDTDALICLGYKLTYAQLWDMVLRFRGILADFGLNPGDRVAIHMPNLIGCVVAYYGTLAAGCTVVMNNPQYADRELTHQLNDSQARVLVTMDVLAQRVINLRPLTSVRRILWASVNDYLPFPKSLLVPLVAKKRGLSADVPDTPDVFRLKDLLEKKKDRPDPVQSKGDDVAVLQYTGGTTGISKGVVLTHRNLTVNLQQVSAWFPAFQEKTGSVLGALPFFHVFGMTACMNLAVHRQGTNILVPRPGVDELLVAISKHKPTFAPLVPSMIGQMLAHPEREKSSLDGVEAYFSGSAPLDTEVMDQFQEATGVPIIEGYGLTESSPVVCVNPFEGEKKPGSIGLPVSDTLVKIVDPEDGQREVAVGERGELAVKGPQVMAGYWKNKQETDLALQGDWLFTGDLAVMDKEGYFYIVDRKKDMIICSGQNVYPCDIEQTVESHPAVATASAIGVPHPTRGEAVKLFVVPREGQEVTEDDIRDFCRDNLAKYKWPVAIEITPELPLTDVGKVWKKKLKDRERTRR